MTGTSSAKYGHDDPRGGSYRRRTRRRVRGGLLVAGLAVGVLGCGDDGDDDAEAESADTTEATDATDVPVMTDPPETTPDTTMAPETTMAPATTEPETTDAPATTGAPETTVASPEAMASTAACAPYYQVNAAMSGAGDPMEVPALLDEIEAVVPPEIDGPLTNMITTAREVIDGGMQDTSAFETPEFADSVAAVDEWMWENCEFDARVEVDAVDFAYEGIDSEYGAGLTAFRVTNAGAEAHEMVLIRRNDGVTDAFEDILALPEEEAMTMVTPMGAAFVGQPGSQETLVADLTPGDYVAICFIPAGTTVADDGSFVEGAGQPHFMLGMRAEFTVT